MPTHATNGQNNGAINLTVTGGCAPYEFLWSNGAITEDISNLAPGIYSVTVTGENGCTAIDNTIINDGCNSSLDVSFVHVPATNQEANGYVCAQLETTMQDVQFQWSTGAFTRCAYNLAAGEYTLTVTDQLGCPTVNTTTVEEVSSNCSLTFAATPVCSENSEELCVYLEFRSNTATPPISIIGDQSLTLNNTFPIQICGFRKKRKKSHFSLFSQCSSLYSFQWEESHKSISS